MSLSLENSMRARAERLSLAEQAPKPDNSSFISGALVDEASGLVFVRVQGFNPDAVPDGFRIDTQTTAQPGDLA